MNRRTLLKIAGAGGAGLVLPDWLARAFAQAAAEGTPIPRAEDPPGVLEAALRRARAAGKPLLVLVIPKDMEEKGGRGRLFGGLLNKGKDEALADLVLCEIACAEMEVVRGALGKGAPAGEPLAVLVETADPVPRARAIDPELPPDVPDRKARPGEGRDMEESAWARVARLADAMREAIAPDRDAIAALAAAAEVGLSPAQTSTLLAIAEGRAMVDVALADRGAALLRRMAEDDPSRRERVIGALREAAVERLRMKPPTGARWASSSGCGFDIEGEPERRFACGMGYVPEASRRFLWFFADR